MKARALNPALLFPAGRRNELGILEDFKEVGCVMQIFFNPFPRFARDLVRTHFIYPGIYSHRRTLAALHPSLRIFKCRALSKARGGFDFSSLASVNRCAVSINAVFAAPTARNLRETHIQDVIVKGMQSIQGHLWLQLLKRYRSMITNPAQITRHHLANQAAPDFSLIRKVCSCGKASTAKQLAQHGKCAACALAAVRDAIMPGDFAKLQHMLGAVQQYPKSKWGWRNYFAAGSGQQYDAMQRLVAAGLATTGRACGDMTYFYATRQGCRVAGLDAAGIKRAMED